MHVKTEHIFHMFFHLLPLTTSLLLVKPITACITASFLYSPFHCICAWGSLVSVIPPHFHDTKSRVFWVNKYHIPGPEALIISHSTHSTYVLSPPIPLEYKSADGPHARHMHDSGFQSSSECIHDYMHLENLPFFPIRMCFLLPSIFGLLVLRTNKCWPTARHHTYNHKS